MRLTISIFFTFLSLFAIGQTQADFSNMLNDIISADKTKKILFSAEENNEHFLCIMASEIYLRDTSVITDRDFFNEQNQHHIYVESLVFIESYLVPYFMMIDSVEQKNNYFAIL